MVEVLIEGRRLDVFEGFDFSFNYGIADVRDPNKRSTEYTKTIKCPSTPNNDLLFGHIYDVNVSNPYNSGSTNIEVNFNPNKKAQCRVIADGVEVMAGVLQLRQINIEMSKYIYDVVFIGKLKNIFAVLGDSLLDDVDDSDVPLIDFSDLDHGLTYAEVVASWGNTTGFTYPMIDYGFTFEYDSDGRRIYDIDVWRPAVFLKDIVDRIFTYAGFTYTSAFLLAEPFTKLIVPWFSTSFSLTDDQVAERVFLAESGSDLSVITGTTPIIISGTSYATKRLEFLDVSDPSSLWDDSAYDFTPLAIGYYSFTGSLTFTITRTSASALTGVLPMALVVKRLSGITETIIDTAPFDLDIPDIVTVGESATTTINWTSAQELLYVGDTVWIESYIETNAITALGGNFTVVMNDESQFFNSVTEQQIFEGSDVYMNNFVPTIKMSDVLLSVFKMFNLYVEVDPLNETNLIIETRSEYYQGGTTVDWTNKLARDKSITITPIGLLTAKEYIYTYSQDGDYYNQRYKDSKGSVYGRRRREIDNDFITNVTTVEVDFSATPLTNDGSSSRIIPKIYDNDVDDGRKPTDFNIRVLHYDGSIPSNPAWVFRYHAGATSVLTITYPYAGHLDHPLTPTLDINFGIPSELYYSASGYTGVLQYTNANLFNVYHRDHIDEITDKDSKVLVGMFQLSSLDIGNLDFRNQILIDNGYWRLNKVMNYNPFSEGLTKVELIKVRDINPMAVGSFTLGGAGVVGTEIDAEDFPVVGNVTLRNGNMFPEFQGTVTGQRNRVSEQASGFNVIGSDNFIGNGSLNVTIFGSRNRVMFGASNVNLINTNDVDVSESNVTYVNNEQQDVGIMQATLTIPSAQILTGNSTPIAFGIQTPTGYAVKVLALDGTLDFGTTPYATNGSVLVRCVGTTDPQAGWTANQFLFGTVTRSVTATLTSSTGVTSDQLIEGADVEAYVSTGNPTAGDSDITLYLTYRLIQI